MNQPNVKPEPIVKEPHLSQDQKCFEELPKTTKEVLILSDRAEKETGRERAALDRLIQIESSQKK